MLRHGFVYFVIVLILEIFTFLSILVQDEDKNSVLKMNLWRKLLKFVRKLNSFDELVAENEATFSRANANGNSEEQ